MSENKINDPQVIKERLGKHLRAADELTRQQRYEEAIMEIEQALELDPKNNYARSFLERVKLMHKRIKESENSMEVSAEVTLEERMSIISQHLSAAEEYINGRDYAHALEQIAEVYRIDPKNYYAQTYSERIETLMLEEGSKTKANDIQPSQSSARQVSTHERGSLLMYRELLKDVWLDGKVTEEEAQELSGMRDIFGISQEDHARLEREIKIEAYLEALRIAWRDNILTDTEQKTLQMMRDKYGISLQEQRIAEKRYDEIKRSSKKRITILIVDNDRESLVSLSKVFKNKGFTIFIAQKAEDALQILNTHTPNLILSEVIYPNNQMDGVGFLKKIRDHSDLRHVPFFFISSISDKKVLHASYRLGVDHFLLKPVDIDTMLAIIEGKLRVSL